MQQNVAKVKTHTSEQATTELRVSSTSKVIAHLQAAEPVSKPKQEKRSRLLVLVV